MRPEFLWEEVADGLFLLLPIEAGRIANRLSCDQNIAEDGFFGLGMIARVEQALRERGEWFYRRLFWECGLIGQVLYLEAEATGGRATGIGCYYDDPVHDLLGLSGHQWQSLYHFSMGLPVEDTRRRPSQVTMGKRIKNRWPNPNSLRIARASSVPSAPNPVGQSSGRGGGASVAASWRTCIHAAAA